MAASALKLCAMTRQFFMASGDGRFHFKKDDERFGANEKNSVLGFASSLHRRSIASASFLFLFIVSPPSTRFRTRALSLSVMQLKGAFHDRLCSQHHIHHTWPVAGKSDIQVVLTEQSDGSILVDLQTLGGNPADLRGLFFDVQHSSILSKLKFVGADIKSTLVADDGVDDWVRRNMKGHGQPNSTLASSSARRAEGIIRQPYELRPFHHRRHAFELDELEHVDFGIRTTSSGQKVIVLTQQRRRA